MSKLLADRVNGFFQRGLEKLSGQNTKNGSPNLEISQSSNSANGQTNYQSTGIFDGASFQKYKLENLLGASPSVNFSNLTAQQTAYQEIYPAGASGLLQFSETKSASDIAYDGEVGEVYQYPDGSYWRVDEVKTGDSGFRGVVLRRVVPDGEGGYVDDPGDNRVVLAFAGTNGADDINDNILQGVGLTPSQYDEAEAMTNEVNAEAQQNGETLILTGHSLGGGLAAYASIQTGVPATAINSAPLANSNVPDDSSFEGQITQYYVDGEILTDLDESNPLDSRPGTKVEINGGYEPPDLSIIPESIRRIWGFEAVTNANIEAEESIENHKLDNAGDEVDAPKLFYSPPDSEFEGGGEEDGSGGGGDRGFGD